MGVEYVGLSFVRSEDDVSMLRRGMKERGGDLPIIAKIEKAQAVSHLQAIAESADAVMVARGDLGVECPIEEVPVLQKRIIRLCGKLGTPVITATQMLESMVESPRPTRAEASDVANAVLDGTDAVMLSAETATGKYPVETVEVMRKIIVNSEALGLEDPRLNDMQALALGDAVGRSAVLAAESIQARAVVCLTQSGASARRLARWRPRAPIFAVTPRRDTWRRLALVRGVTPVHLDDGFGDDFDRECGRILDLLRRRRHLVGGDVSSPPACLSPPTDTPTPSASRPSRTANTTASDVRCRRAACTTTGATSVGSTGRSP